jgi:hypothetical protein
MLFASVSHLAGGADALLTSNVEKSLVYLVRKYNDNNKNNNV